MDGNMAAIPRHNFDVVEKGSKIVYFCSLTSVCVASFGCFLLAFHPVIPPIVYLKRLPFNQ